MSFSYCHLPKTSKNTIHIEKRLKIYFYKSLRTNVGNLRSDFIMKKFGCDGGEILPRPGNRSGGNKCLHCTP